MSRFEQSHVVIMGVSGCGKSTVGAALAALSRLEYVDGDDLHPVANVDKMRAGIPLTDADRQPWLEDCGAALGRAHTGLILGCSALKLSYREIIRRTAFPAKPVFVYLHGSREVLSARMGQREGHYMPTSLLDSQLATLEPPTGPEGAITVDIDQPADRIAELIFNGLGWRAESIARQGK
ncbi:gluconokinase [Phaeobacter sp. B1627]|uniref:gluconokinase n=1 Tax=Phaeobacter sp. B1627 TaxID=2583809 RepID=UPI0021060E5A|nr:gluconokinase [Phaeobacter sp. B1627]